MNKWTLRFQSENLEQQYQQKRQEDIQKVIFLISSLGLLGLSAGQLVVDTDEENPVFWAILIPQFVIGGICLIFGLCKKKYFKLLIIILNYAIAFCQVLLRNSATVQQAYFYGSNITTSQLILLSVSDYIDTVHQIIFFFILRTFYVNNQSPQIGALPYLFQGCVAICLIYVYYKINQAYRTQFLLNVKEEKLMEFIPKVCLKPYIIFQYSEHKFQPKCVSQNMKESELWQNNLCDGCNLRWILRNTTQTQKTLEFFLLQHLVEDNLKDQEFYLNKPKIGLFKIKAIIIKQEIYSFVIVFDKIINNHSLESQKNSILLYRVNKLFMSLFIYLNKKKLNRKIIQAICISYLSQIYSNNWQIQQFDLIETLKGIIKKLGVQNIEIIAQDSFNITNYKWQYVLYFINVFWIFSITQCYLNKLKLVIYSTDIDNLNIAISDNSINKIKFNEFYYTNKYIRQIETTQLILYSQTNMIFNLNTNFDRTFSFSDFSPQSLLLFKNLFQ